MVGSSSLGKCNKNWTTGDIPGGPGHDDPDAHPKERLCKVQQGGRDRRHGTGSWGRVRVEAGGNHFWILFPKRRMVIAARNSTSETIQVHGDVFRAAASPMLFSSLIGTGAQLAVVVLFVVMFAIIGG